MRRGSSTALLPVLAILLLVPGVTWAAQRAGLAETLERELGLTRQAVDLERAIDALERAQAGTEYTIAILDHTGRESVRKLDAYRTSKGDRGAQVRLRARAMYKLARGGVMRMALEPVDRSGVAAAERVSRGRDLRWLVRHDLQELAVYHRAEVRAHADLVDAMRGFQAVSAITMITELQEAGLGGAQGAVEPELGRTKRSRRQSLARRHHRTKRDERQLMRLLKDNWKELDALRGLTAGQLVRPVRGAVAGEFGAYEDPVLRLPMERNGVELKATLNEAVRAAAAGRVAMVARLPGYEEVVVLDHGGGQFTMTGRMWRLEVAEGDDVDAGDVLGFVAPKVVDDGLGTTVYLELRHGDKPVDPAQYLRGRRRSRAANRTRETSPD
jgi:hypothetical protein